MQNKKLTDFIKLVLENMPDDWLKLTTHRLDIYDEQLAKTEFLAQIENFFTSGFPAQDQINKTLSDMPTAYDYIRLGHPLSCILEWALAKSASLPADHVISFSSYTMPLMAVLRKNLLGKKATEIFYSYQLPASFDEELVRKVYGYQFQMTWVENEEELHKIMAASQDTSATKSTIFISENSVSQENKLPTGIDFFLNIYPDKGSVMLVNGDQNQGYISEIQHVRRRETIAMTPSNCLSALHMLIGQNDQKHLETDSETDKKAVLESIKQITGTTATPLVASSGLSMQYAIMMGLIDEAQQKHPSKKIRFIVPPNCYGGTNDQARRVAACLPDVEIVDLLVDGENDMVQSINSVLAQLATEDAVPFIIAEIPTNPRVEVPDLFSLKEALSASRKTETGENAVAPVFILDQTFCPDFSFLGEGKILSTVKAISYASGSKFPSGGKCTAGYCVANSLAEELLPKIETHLNLCDNEATSLQYAHLAEQLPSMNQRIEDAYVNTREFVNFIRESLPAAKINFVSEELAELGFKPSVFSLDLPTKGETAQEQEAYKRALNLKLINKMITEIPDESKYCVSYGQLKGCYWTIPATSTQGTTKEGDKDYIIRAALSPKLDLELHKKVFREFVEEL
ncbi:cystathionine beta-synthase [Algoriphagus sp.]|uniref:cystathionine beta-synthase n=1 Tax=Algoriphagus sp. TaxID=1872435 RepID=UPI0032793B0F